MSARRRLALSIQGITRQAWFARVASPVMPALDKASHRLSGGRWLVSSLVVPAVLLETTGARSGQLRQSPLATVPDGPDWLVVGSNWGGEKHPAWTANLLAHPDAVLVQGRRRVPVRATLLDPAEKAAVWPTITALWPSYDAYVERSGRDLRVFRLSRR